MNWHVTIDYGWPDEGDELKPSRLHRDVRNRVRSWWYHKRQKGQVTGDFFDVVIWEAPSGKHHAHWMLHIPQNLLDEAIAVINSRAMKVLGEIERDTLHQQEIENVNGLVSYLLKGTEPDYAEKVGIRPKHQGTIWCRRAVPAMALGRAARERDWRTGRVVHGNSIEGLPPPREKRVMMREAASMNLTL